MRTIPPLLAGHLAGGATTLATCWKLTRRDGTVMGFTDHDRDLAFGGTTYLARTGFEASEVTSERGFAVGGAEVAGALSADGITEADLEAGFYDAAEIETILVNWSDPGQRMVLAKATIGEVKRQDRAFLAELRGVAHTLDQEQGRIYALACDADLGDARCGVDLGSPAYCQTATVDETDGRFWIASAALGASEPGRFTAGKVAWLTGGNAGTSIEVKNHLVEEGSAVLDLWRPAAEPIQSGDTLKVTSGCDKTFATCRAVFGNAPNFRGFPHIPGNDKVLTFASEGGGNTGKSFFK